jgi:hypothetical protein
MGNEKFASEIFGHKPLSFYVATQTEITGLCEPASNQRGINRFKGVRINPGAGFSSTSSGECPIKNL